MGIPGLLKFLALPIHPLFVYDGREKPPFKRGKATGGSYGNAPIVRLSKTLVDLFKFPRHDAPGEAEAECARLQQAGVVDCVMSNDVDALMFGSSLTIMNFSKEGGSGPATHVTCYKMDGLEQSSKEKVDRAGMILFAILSGGDYLPSGVPKCGSKLAAEIAKAGFGADLMEALDYEGPELDIRLNEWRERLQYELEENESGYFQTKHKAVRIPETFPDKTILSFYAKPIVSTDEDVYVLQRRLANAWDREIDVMELRKFTATAFEWNYRSGARKVIRLLAEPLVSYRLRLQKRPSAFPEDAPTLSDNATPMLHKIYKSRTIFNTDGLMELQLDYTPIDIVGLDLLAEEPNPPLPSQESTVSGDEEEDLEADQAAPPPSPTKKRVTKRYDPYASGKIWVFEAVAMIGIPEIVERWKKEQSEKSSAATKPKTRKTGPRKKGPIDPGMKRGSILKYGTLMKERPDVSQFKNAQLFEEAISRTPTKPSPSLLRSSQVTSSMTRDISSPQYMTSVASPVLNSLTGRLTSACNILSPGNDTKRHPMFSQPRATSRRGALSSETIETEVVDISSEDNAPESPCVSVSRRVRMSYSNSTALAEPIMNGTLSPTPKRQTRRTITKALQSQEIDEAHELVTPPHRRNTQPSKLERQLPPSPTKQHSRRTRAQNRVLEDEAVYSSSSVEEISPPRIQDLLEKAALDMRSLRKRQSKRSSTQPPIDLPEEDRPEDPITQKPRVQSDKTENKKLNSCKPSSHLKSVVAGDGFWTTESTPEHELASSEYDAKFDYSPGDKPSKNPRRKRLPRVSILDLTKSP
ncbi:hypothetical protein FE257_012550 [Aspergillus nanangensis]|uniref:XPG-I domain-containing protein n=1 Tax=Aspergillus nanangensis TaxID=2582783 RepID=A0AAD4CUU8_ASPNN|nr:hypothetical protein FE257_012550 [Aspergillus nanangensis]